MEIGRGHFQGSVEAYSYGTTPTIREVAHEGDAEFSTANAPEAGAHRRRCTKWSPFRQQFLLLVRIQIPQFCLRCERLSLQKAKDMSAKPENPRQEAGRSPFSWVEEAKARVARLEGAFQLLGVDRPDSEPIKVVLETARGQCRVFPVGERLDSCLKFVECAKGRVLKQQVGQVQVVVAQGLTDLECLRAEARVTPSRHCSPRGGGWEQRRRVGCFAWRS